MELAVVGGSEFVLGFQMTGIRKVFEIEEKENAAGRIEEVMKDSSIGIVVIDDKTMNGLDERVREAAEISVKPVFVVLSIDAGQEALRKMILKSIGVDLWGRE